MLRYLGIISKQTSHGKMPIMLCADDNVHAWCNLDMVISQIHAEGFEITDLNAIGEPLGPDFVSLDSAEYRKALGRAIVKERISRVK